MLVYESAYMSQVYHPMGMLLSLHYQSIPGIPPKGNTPVMHYQGIPGIPPNGNALVMHYQSVL